MRLVHYIKAVSFRKFLLIFLTLTLTSALAVVASVYWPELMVSFITLSIVLMIIGVVAIELRFPERGGDGPGSFSAMLAGR